MNRPAPNHLPKAPHLSPKDIGRTLRESRESMGISVKDVADALRIRARYIEALENGENDKLPGEVYQKGYMKSYAKFLQMEDQLKLVEQLHIATATTAPVMPYFTIHPQLSRNKKLLIVVSSIIAFSILVTTQNQSSNISQVRPVPFELLAPQINCTENWPPCYWKNDLSLSFLLEPIKPVYFKNIGKNNNVSPKKNITKKTLPKKATIIREANHITNDDDNLD